MSYAPHPNGGAHWCNRPGLPSITSSTWHARVSTSPPLKVSRGRERLAPLILEVSDEVKRAHYVATDLIQTDERTLERLMWTPTCEVLDRPCGWCRAPRRPG